MNYEEMIKKAEKYNEMLELHRKKPQLIEESRQLISQLEKEIEELEKDGASEALKQSLNKLSPKRFFSKKTADVDVDELILQKELAIKREKKKIDALENTKTKDLINISEVVQECAAILNNKKAIFEGMHDEIDEAREKYHSLLDKYNEELKQHNTFAKNTAAKIQQIASEGFIPQYMGDVAPSFTNTLQTASMSGKLITAHRLRPTKTTTLYQ